MPLDPETAMGIAIIAFALGMLVGAYLPESSTDGLPTDQDHD